VSILLELLHEFLVALIGGLGPSSDRGILITNATGAFGGGIAATLLHALEFQGWALVPLLLCLICAFIGALLSPVYAHRNPSERLFGWGCFAGCVIGPLIPLAFW